MYRLAVGFTVIWSLTAPAVAQEDQPPITSPEPTSQPATRPHGSAPAVEITRKAPLASDGEEPPAPPRRVRGDDEDEDRDEPIRAAAGNMGLFFRFGGLATLTASGTSRAVNQLLLSQVGLKIVLSERWMLPITVGMGVRNVEPDSSGSSSISPESQTDVGFDLSFGFEHHFRIWRRISPFVGLGVGFGVVNPAGDDQSTEKAIYGFSFGPSLGVEYYVADRVSLTAQYLFTFQFEWASERYDAFQVSSMAGGALNLTCYF